MIRLRIEQVNKSFTRLNRQLYVLNEISLDVEEGKVVAIVGPSGCGKSTLLRLAAGLDFPDSGRVLYNEAKVVGPSPARGIVFQDYSLFPWRTVRKNISFGLEIKKIPQKLMDCKVSEWIHRIGLDNFDDFYPSELSGGMRQRVALARTLITEPQLILMDEPFAALDAVNRRILQDVLQGLLNTENRTALLITHDATEAVYLADNVVVLSSAPASILNILEIPSKRPRVRGEIYDPILVECIKRVNELIGG